MPIFSYTGFSNDGTKKNGTCEAATRLAARKILTSRGYRILELSEKELGRANAGKKLFPPLKAKDDLKRLFMDIAVLMEAGLTLDRALKAVADQGTIHPSHALAHRLLDKLSSGSAPSEAFEAEKTIGPHICALVASGEHVGKLASVFLVIANDLESQQLRRRQIAEAIVYPLFLVLMIFAALMIVTFFLVPAILPIFEGAGKQAPLMIRALDAVRGLIVEWGALLAFSTCLVGVILHRAGNRVHATMALSRIVLLSPVIGTIIRKYGLARYLQSLALLLGNGVEMTKALALATATCPIKAYLPALELARDEVISGRRFSKALEATGLFPPAIISLTVIGDEVNKLPSILSRSAALLEGEASRSQSRLLAAMTPVITILMGGMIGGLVLSVMSALLSINDLSVK